MALPRQHRLKGKREFSAIFSGTRLPTGQAGPAVSEHYSLRATRNQKATKSAFAVVVPAKIVPLATARNLLRRRTSEAVARIIRTATVAPGVSAVVSVRTTRLPEAVAIERELLSLMKKSGILN